MRQFGEATTLALRLHSYLVQVPCSRRCFMSSITSSTVGLRVTEACLGLGCDFVLGFEEVLFFGWFIFCKTVG